MIDCLFVCFIIYAILWCLRGSGLCAVHVFGAFADRTTGTNLQVELVEPPEDSAPGDRVSVQGYEEEPDEQLNPKKKIFEQVAVLS